MTIHEQITNILAEADCHQAPAVYAGIGARATPDWTILLIRRISLCLAARHWTLRSGGADGADVAFAKGIVNKEVYLPWKGFNGVHGPRLYEPSSTAMRLAADYHPKWNILHAAVRKLHARNVHQILGADCMSPCAMVICWTPDGSTGITTARTGGTGQALRIAYAHGVPIFNLQRPGHRAAWEAICAE